MSEIIGAQTGSDPLIKDATIESFEQDVLAASMEMPIIVDFWAEWCGPCKQLTPVLEKAVTEAGGSVKLVKVDIDKNQMLASQLRIQSVPTVYAFFQGRPVDGFQGAVPESEIKAFIGRLTDMTGAPSGSGPTIDEILEAATQALAGDDVSSAAQLFSQAAQLEPENAAALAGLARCQMAVDDFDAAEKTLALIPADKKNDPAVSGVIAALELSKENTGGEDLSALRLRAEASPDDMEAQFEFAAGLIGAGQMEAAIDLLLAMIERDREWNEAAARKKLLTVFDALGGSHPATLKGRRRLSSILFS